MMTPMRYHPAPSATRTSKTGFGFDDVMAGPDYTAFRSWWDDNSYFALTRDEIEDALSHPFSAWPPVAYEDAA